MTIGIIGRKRGMTRVFTEEGQSVPVTVIEAEPNKITRVLDAEHDGYRAVQIAWGSKKTSRVNKPLTGIFSKAEITAGEGLYEFRLGDSEGEDLAQGGEIKVDIFEVGQKVDVTGTTIGKGFAGAVKRHNFSMQNATHGNSLSHRSAGSIGQNQTPGRVFKGKKMAGQLGNKQRATQNLEVVRVDADRNLILIKGAVPGAKGGKVIIKPAIKARA
ncbi:MAG: 50S ribosomal protein L3 [Gammaproteobacteria bacterium]|nr:50S ribosomal protein L3 [Gammaproteobacteria bacterium]NIN61792.1 50S ribosomal protein L3 [Gammaproteobacteria bacterium]NIO63534.1 50S ribosomal protein L3 [Gammaproteobacteria bacterium]NIP49335.1 50S ribosomal protein L3 [Gammaproteobacteria bacterium]NIQ10559.1 50S ribosomal protein L3 [Gammaproteobacteria bacterium]